VVRFSCRPGFRALVEIKRSMAFPSARPWRSAKRGGVAVAMAIYAAPPQASK